MEHAGRSGRVLRFTTIKQTVARGVQDGVLAYVSKSHEGKYQPFAFERSIQPEDVELSDDVFIITRETALAYRESQAEAAIPGAQPTSGTAPASSPDGTESSRQSGVPTPFQLQPTPAGPAKSLTWTGEVPAQKWMNFYTKVLSRFVSSPGLRLEVSFEVPVERDQAQSKVDETRAGLKELGLDDSSIQI